MKHTPPDERPGMIQTWQGGLLVALWMLVGIALWAVVLGLLSSGG